MMKKRAMAAVLAATLAGVALVGGTLAYFQDQTPVATNTMTTGSVEIVQKEWQRGAGETGLANLVEMPNGITAKLIPAVYNGTLAYDGTMTTPNGDTVSVFDKTVDNEIDKVVTVTNTGSESAYVRTIFLFENDAQNSICEKLHTLECGSDGQGFEWLTNADGSEVQVTIDDVTYSIAVCTYNTPLAPGATSDPSLMQIFLDPTATQAWYENLGTDRQLTIKVLSQGVQSAGFETEGATAALDAAFGAVNAENVEDWFTTTNA